MSESDRIAELEAELSEVLADLVHKQRVNEELKAENARLKELGSKAYETGKSDELIEENRRLSEQLGKCREALKPFAAMPKERGPWNHGDGCPAEVDDTDNVACRCGAWDAIDKAQDCLTSLSKG